MRFLRKKLQLSRKEFGDLFNVTDAMIKSYEDKSFPPVEKFLEITKHFRLDSNNFVKFDMTIHDVYQNTNTPSEHIDSKNHQRLDLNQYVSKDSRFSFVDQMPHDTIKRLCKNLLKDNDEINSKYEDCKSSLIEAQKLIIELKNKNKDH